MKVRCVDLALTHNHSARGAHAADGEGWSMQALTRLLRDEAGASAAEYALLIGIVGSAIAIGAALLAQAISSAMLGTGDCIGGAASCQSVQ